MRRIINKLTLFFGFFIQRIPSLKSLPLLTNRNPVYIEFIGASGVGKSTLFEKVMNKSWKKWMSIKHFEVLYRQKLKSRDFDKQPLYQELALYRINEVVSAQDEILPFDMLEACSSGYNTISLDALVHLYNKESIVISEEGLLQFNSNAIKHLITSDKNSMKSLLNNRAVVYCYTSPEIVVDRILKREMETGNIWFKHKGLSKDELYKVVSDNIEEKHNLIKVLEKHIPILYIDTNEDLKNNRKKVIDFILSNHN